jgi:D-alanine-D-alanine ligase
VRNKFHWNSFLAQGNYNVCKNWLYDYRTGWLFNQLPEENTKIICKLNSESSSIGLSQKNIFTFSPEKESFIHDLSKKFRQRVIVQEFIEGREIEVPVISLPNKAFSFDPVGISVSDQKELEDVILDYDIRGNNKFGFYDFKNDDEELSERIKLYVEKVANELEIFGYGRIDFRIRNNGQFYITDIATNPHITKSMSFYYAFKQLGYSYQDVLSTLFGLIIESKRE